jgi:hypothetical protein
MKLEILAARGEIGRLTDEVRVILEESRLEAARLRTEPEMVAAVDDMRKTVQSLAGFSPTFR